jgi:uncharacterized protein
MNHRRRGLGRFGLLVLILVLLLPACGRKTMPVPPQDVEPVPVADLRYRLDEQGVTLSWTAPARTVAGSKLGAVEGFEIHRAEVPEEQYCPGCPLPFGPPIKYRGAPLQPGRAVSYTEKKLRPGHRYFYKIRTRFGWHLTSQDSNQISFTWKENRPAPATELTP